jgi:hypothetical protein
MLPAPFIQTPVLTSIVVGYRNNLLIADSVLPRVPVGGQQFKYLVYPPGEALTVPNTRVGRRSRPTTVEFSATETPASTDDYSLEDPIPNSDIEIAQAMRVAGVSAYDPEARAAQGLTDLLLLDREIRVANTIFSASTYDATRQLTLSGTSQFSDTANSTPIDTITAGMDATLIYRPNVHVMGRAVWSKLRAHPHLVNAVKGGTYGRGLISKQDYCDLFEIEELLIGESFLNTARRGQPVTTSRVWGKHIAMFYRDKNADTNKAITFGLTAQWGTRLGGKMPDPNIGMRGGQTIRVGEAVKELITAPSVGYLIQNAVA